MKKRLKLVIFIFILVNLMTILMCFNNTFATDDIDELIRAVGNNAHAIDPSEHNAFISINKGITILQVVGSGIAVIAVTMLGGKYIMASPSEKAETKKLILPKIIGCVLVFGAVNIVATIVKFGEIFNGL